MSAADTLPGSMPVPPAPDPQAIRASLSSALAVEFDREWAIVLDRVKQSMDLGDLHDWLNKWRHTAYLEMSEPGAYQRILATAELIERSGQNPAAASYEEMQAVIRERRRAG